MTENLIDSLQTSAGSIPHVVAEVVSDSTLHNISSMMETTANNTTFGWLPDGIDLTIAGVALLFSFVTWLAQWRTERNTSRMSMKEQKLLLTDMVRHFYRNLVVCYSMKVKMEKEDFKVYPSEEHLLKLKVNLDDIHLNLFYKKDEFHNLMNDLYVKLRNYNIEIDVICEHFKSKSLEIKEENRDPHEIKKRDLDTLIFKSGFLTQQIVEAIGQIWYKDSTWRKWLYYKVLFKKEKIEEMKAIASEANKNNEDYKQTTKNVIKENSKLAFFDIAKITVKTAQENNIKQNKEESFYYKDAFTGFKDYINELDANQKPKRKSFHAQKLFKGDEDTFYTGMDMDVKIECGNNKSGSNKIYMIPLV